MYYDHENFFNSLRVCRDSDPCLYAACEQIRRAEGNAGVLDWLTDVCPESATASCLKFFYSRKFVESHGRERVRLYLCGHFRNVYLTIDRRSGVYEVWEKF